ncbi:MAG: hypothetical protein AAF730_12225 [Bacteroidota bacterium]
MDPSPNTTHQSSLLVPGLLLVLLFLTSTNFAVFLKQQCHWTQKIPLVSRLITCLAEPQAEVTIKIVEEDGCFEPNVEAFRAYDTFDALGDVAPDRTARANRTITIQRSVPVAEHAVHRVVITRGGATSPQGLQLYRNTGLDCKQRTVRVYDLHPE